MYEMFGFELLMVDLKEVKAEGHLTSPECEGEWLREKKRKRYMPTGTELSETQRKSGRGVLNYIIMYI